MFVVVGSQQFLQLAVKLTERERGREREEKVAKIGEATKQSRARLGLPHLASRGASELTLLLLVARLGGLGVWSDEFFVFATS